MTIKNSTDSLENFLNTGTLDVQALQMNGTTLSPATPGTVDASCMIVVDSNKDLATLRNVTITTLTNTTLNGTTINGTTINAGASGTAGTVSSFPTTASKGKLILAAVDSAAAYNTTISNASMGQASVISIPDPGAATSKFVLQDGTNTSATITTGTVTTLTSTTANITNLKYGATPVAQVDPASCTISGVSGASNVCTVTVQLKDGSGTNMARVIPCEIYISSASDGLTLATASTGFSIVSGGIKRAAASATITQGIAILTSATGGCVLSLTDSGKGANYLVIALPSGLKISTVLSSGSYGA